MLVVRGGPITAVARGSSGEPVVLLRDGDPAGLDEEDERAVLDLGAAVLDSGEFRLLRACLEAVRRGDPAGAREITTPWGSMTVVSCGGFPGGEAWTKLARPSYHALTRGRRQSTA